MKFPVKILVAPDKYFAVEQTSLNGPLGCVDIDKETIFIEKDQPEAGKYSILLHEIIHIADERNILGKVYRKRLTEPQVTYLSGMVFLILGSSGLIKGVTKKMISALLLEEGIG